MKIPENIFPGAQVKLHCFGLGVIRKVYQHHDTREMVADIKAHSGATLHLTLAYAQTILQKAVV